MKTKAMKHQGVGTRRMKKMPDYYALGAEQGTGKTWMFLSDAEHQFKKGLIDALLIVAPKGVHTNWILREIPEHLSILYRSDYYVSGAGTKKSRALSKMLTTVKFDYDPKLTIIAINIDAVNTPKGYAFAKKFLENYDAMMVIDESHTIKEMRSKRTQKCIALGGLAKSRRIGSGTMLGNGPIDLFAQAEFLLPGGKLLGTTSVYAFTAEFAELLPEDNPLVRHIVAEAAKKGRRIQPQIVQKDAAGDPIWKNTKKLQKLLKPWVYRVLKKDCLDLPDKIYQTVFFDLTPKQRKLYEEVRTKMRLQREDGEIEIFTPLTIGMKLRQVTSGFIMTADRDEPTKTVEKGIGPRMDALKTVLEGIKGQFIIWAVFRAELAAIEALLTEMEISFMPYHGGTKKKERDEAIDAFQAGTIRGFVSNAQTGGTGLTLTAAETAIYYSNDYSMLKRSQSEDRNHRKGTKKNVVYIDIVGQDSIDVKVSAALQSKARLSAAILNAL